jgi:membrane-bound lytic murein transglycosylase B
LLPASHFPFVCTRLVSVAAFLESAVWTRKPEWAFLLVLEAAGPSTHAQQHTHTHSATAATIYFRERNTMSNHHYEERAIGIKDKNHDGNDHQNEIRVVKKPKPNNGHNVITGCSQGSSF